MQAEKRMYQQSASMKEIKKEKTTRGEGMKKRILALTMSVLMAASLAGCSKQLSNEYITIKQYEGLEVPKAETTEVTDADVESMIQSNLNQAATTEEIKDRAAENGDTVNIDYKGSIDGVEFEGGAAEGADLELGSGSFIGATEDYKGFEEQIVGHKIGETFDITVQFPENYKNNPDMASKVAVFNIKLNKISVKKVPELTDEWVKSNSEKSKTVEEYKKEIKKTLEDSNKESVKSTLQNSVLEALVDQVDVKKLPEKDVNDQIDSIKNYYTQMAAMYGMEFEDFRDQMMQMTEDDFASESKKAAETAVTRKLACELIAKKKNLEPSDKEYEKQIKEYAGDQDVDEFKEQVGEDVLKNTILQQKVAEYLAEKCVQVEQTETKDNTNTK